MYTTLAKQHVFTTAQSNRKESLRTIGLHRLENVANHLTSSDVSQSNVWRDVILSMSREKKNEVLILKIPTKEQAEVLQFTKEDLTVSFAD